MVLGISEQSGGSATPDWYNQLINPPRTKKVPLSPVDSLMGYQTVPTAPAPRPAVNPVAPAPISPGPTGQYSFRDSAPIPSGVADPGALQTIPSPEDWLTKDDVYQALLRRYNENENAFRAQNDRANSLLDTNSVEQQHGLEKQQGIDLTDLLESYAGRGVVHSSGYGNNVNDVGNAYAQRLAAVEQNRTRGHEDNASALADFIRNKTADVEQTRAEALARRLAKYGV